MYKDKKMVLFTLKMMHSFFHVLYPRKRRYDISTIQVVYQNTGDVFPRSVSTELVLPRECQSDHEVRRLSMQTIHSTVPLLEISY